MKTFLLLATTVAVCAASAILDDGIGREKTYPRFIEFPDGEGNMHLVDLEAPVDESALNATRNAANNQYWLYTRRNPLVRQVLTINNANSVTSSNFDASKPVHVICHGWLSSGITDPNLIVRQALLNREDANVITVDWSDLASSDYATAVIGVPGVGRGVCQFLMFLNNNFNVPFSNMHLIGFSLGGHLVGNAGRECGGRIARITSLDPAGPLWNYNSNRVSPSDGVYVEAIHTDGGSSVGALGIGTAVANVDFFPNGGNSQPGCVTNFCNHIRAYELFASSITNNNLYGNLCNSNLQITFNTCRGALFELGNHHLNKWGTGMYRLDTGRSYPY